MIKIENLSKPLDIDQIEFRVQSINKGGYATMLAYKDARVDMRRLDDVCTPLGWQRDHKEVKGVVYCGIGIKSDDGIVWKWDAGTESMAEKQKGEASDSFKRAGFNWGIGRELYGYPSIKIKLNSNEFITDNNGRAKQTFNLKLRDWNWTLQLSDNGDVTFLGAADDMGNARYSFGKFKGKVPTEKPANKPVKDPFEKKELTAAIAKSEAGRKVPLATMMRIYDMTGDQQQKYIKLIEGKKIKDVQSANPTNN